MSYKTDRLVNLFPDAYAAKDSESLLYKLLDALGAEFMDADDVLKRLLKSHWVNYAEGKALDRLGSIYGISRRRLPHGIKLFSTGLGFSGDLENGLVPGTLRQIFANHKFPLSSNVPVAVEISSTRWLIDDLDEQRTYQAQKEEDRLTFYLLTETDEAFRLRLKSVVNLFTGGGTLKAVKGAVQSALGLPFNLEQLNLTAGAEALRADLENLVTIVEFSPEVSSIIENRLTEVDEASQLILTTEAGSVQAVTPQIQWQFTKGGGRRLTLESLDSGEGIQSDDSLIVPAGETLRLSSELDGSLSAILAGQNVATAFTNLDGTTPARLPEVPGDRDSEWKFRAKGGLFDISTFDRSNTFDLPEYLVEMRWVRYEPLTFDVYVPYFLQNVVESLKARHGFAGSLFVFEGLPREQIQTVVNQTQAAGVRGSVAFSLTFFETHDQADFQVHEKKALGFRVSGVHQTLEDADTQDSLSLGSFNRETEAHDVAETFVMGGVFDVSTFDTHYGFQ